MATCSSGEPLKLRFSTVTQVCSSRASKRHSTSVGSLPTSQSIRMRRFRSTALTATSVFYVYLNSFPYLKLGYGAALSLILAVIILIFTIVQMILTRRSHA